MLADPSPRPPTPIMETLRMTMRAWRFDRLGEPRDVLHLDDIAVPEPGSGEVLVRVRAATVNFADTLVVRGVYQVQPPLPATPGMELCGEVLEVGQDVPTAIELGSRVIGIPAAGHGAFSEYTVLRSPDVLPAPDQLDDAEASALMIAYQTGWFGLHRRARLEAGETLLVHAAAGGVGSAAVQLGVAAGATVIGVVGGPDKVAGARDAGCSLVIDRSVTDVVGAVKAATGGRGADVVYDPVGGDAFVASTKCIAFEGRIVIVGFASGDVPRARTEHALVKNYSVVGLHWGLYRSLRPDAVRAAHDELCRLVSEGALRPWVTRRAAFEDVPEAMEDVAGGKTEGRVVVVPTHA